MQNTNDRLNHSVYCYYCQIVINMPHNFDNYVCQYNDLYDGYHTEYCDICECYYYVLHDFEYYDIIESDVDGHYMLCNDCGYYKKVNHEFTRYYNEYGHYDKCTICGYETEISAHTTQLNCSSLDPHNHYLYCTECDYRLSTTLTYQIYHEYEHWCTCSICNTRIHEPHEENCECIDNILHMYMCYLCDIEYEMPHFVNNHLIIYENFEPGYDLWVCTYCGYMEIVNMRKIFCALTLSMLSFLVVFCGDFDEKKPFGSTYSEPIEVGDFLYCLRSDGYYQCIGLSNSGFEAKTLMVPDYINGIPVMGFGISCEDTGYSQCYHGDDIPLEYNSLHESKWVVREKVDGNETGRIICPEIVFLNIYTYYVDKDRQLQVLFPGATMESLKKECKCETLYINCHHVNGTYRLLEALNNMDDEQRQVKKIVWEPNSSNESCYKHFYGFFKNFKPGDPIHVTSPLTVKRINEAELYYYKIRKQFPIYDDEEYIKTLRESSEIINYWGMTYAEKMEEMKSRISANIEFRYNLYINGNLYVKEGFEDRFDEEYDERDLYWIDYVNEGETIQEPLDPYIEGYKFLGWYIDSECTTKWNFTEDSLNSETLKLYAKWDKI